ncbi:MAG TPA: antibiotic biosynthesis monooxygenase [Pseudonocardia sp.]|nr:antibiotic biosynthesis monooxygenase [Pseudonocardia sp.]
MPEPVAFINCFAVPPGRDEEFLRLWRVVNAYMAAQPGYLDHRLHRALSPESRYRYINVVHWASSAAWQAAHDEGFQALVSEPAWAEFPPVPALCEVLHHGALTGGEQSGRPAREWA